MMETNKIKTITKTVKAYKIPYKDGTLLNPTIPKIKGFNWIGTEVLNISKNKKTIKCKFQYQEVKNAI